MSHVSLYDRQIQNRVSLLKNNENVIVANVALLVDLLIIRITMFKKRGDVI